MVRRAETRAILRGDEDLSEWTDRELEYGTRKLPNGYWPPKPRTIASAVHDELVKRKLRQAVELVRVSTPRAIKLLVQILDDDEATNRDRIKAAEVILDRALGKAPEHVNLSLAGAIPAWQRMIKDAVLVGTEEQARALPPKRVENEADDDEGDEAEDDVIEGEIVEEPAAPTTVMPTHIQLGDEIARIRRPELESEPEPEGLAEAFFWPHGPLLPLADGEEYLDCLAQTVPSPAGTARISGAKRGDRRRRRDSRRAPTQPEERVTSFSARFAAR